MTDEDARMVAEILVTADNGCDVCASRLFELFSGKTKGRFDAILAQVWTNEFEYEWSREDDD